MTCGRVNDPFLCELSLSPAQEGEPLQQEVACFLDALRVGAPVLEAVVGEITQDVQPLSGGNVPVSVLLNLSEEPRLDQRTPANRKWFIQNDTDDDDDAV